MTERLADRNMLAEKLIYAVSAAQRLDAEDERRLPLTRDDGSVIQRRAGRAKSCNIGRRVSAETFSRDLGGCYLRPRRCGNKLHQAQLVRDWNPSRQTR